MSGTVRAKAAASEIRSVPGKAGTYFNAATGEEFRLVTYFDRLVRLKTPAVLPLPKDRSVLLSAACCVPDARHRAGWRGDRGRVAIRCGGKPVYEADVVASMDDYDRAGRIEVKLTLRGGKVDEESLRGAAAAMAFCSGWRGLCWQKAFFSRGGCDLEILHIGGSPVDAGGFEVVIAMLQAEAPEC